MIRVLVADDQTLVRAGFRVLVDSASRRRASELAGRTSGNTVVNFPGPPDLIGQEVDVTITAAAPNSVRGELVAVTQC